MAPSEGGAAEWDSTESRRRGKSSRHQRRRDGRGPVHPEQRLERARGEEPAQGRADAHPQVDGQPVEREGLPAEFGWGQVAHQREGGGAHRLRHCREHHHPREDLGERPEERKRPEPQPAEEQRQGEDALRAHAVREPAGEGRGEERDDPVDGQRHPGLTRREAQVPGEVEGQEGDDHRPRAVDEGGQGEQPAVARKTRQIRPGIERTPGHGGSPGRAG